MVCFGDPAWDLGGALQDLLNIWISSMPSTGDLAAEELAARAGFPLHSVHSAARSLWSGYCEAARLAGSDGAGFFRRAVRFSAARLIQSAYELAEGLSSLPDRSVLLLQIGANLLADAELGQVQLFGVPPGSSAS
jgi:hypothetical protein